ncbi:hypothetical protein SAMN05216241_108131 [Limimonas halophila]|uniref:Uncharacterized protein n=1 Tax=Limimonas halophila TaxID=1082479 RepID=A0A1G7T9K7_9PROT|nr:hypothetical protein [Limimonas halophila]SDG31309.1 hypothetical protein SAMN05216241_108131 [Limimonas halophila]
MSDQSAGTPARTSPYLLRRRRSLEEVEADRDRDAGPESDKLPDRHERLDNFGLNGSR